MENNGGKGGRRVDWGKPILIFLMVVLSVALILSLSGPRSVRIDRIGRVEIDTDGDTFPEHIFLVGSIRVGQWDDNTVTLQVGPLREERGAATPTPFQ